MKLMQMVAGGGSSRWFLVETGPDGRSERSRHELDENGDIKGPETVPRGTPGEALRAMAGPRGKRGKA